MKVLPAVLLAAALSASALAAGKPVAVMGTRWAARSVEQRILLYNNLAFELHEEWLPPAEYGRYSAVYFAEGLQHVAGVGDAWADPEAFEHALEYVRSGGVVIMTGGAPYHLANRSANVEPIEPLVGFGRLLRSRGPESFRVADPDSPLVAHLAPREHRCAWAFAISGVTTARSILDQVDEDGGVICPFATIHEVGDGKAYWFAAPFFRFSDALSSRGEPDHIGPYRLTEAEQDVEAYRRVIEKAVLLAEPSRGRWTIEEWEPTPLGEFVPEQDWPGPELAPVPPAPEPPEGPPVALAEGGEARCAVVLPEGAGRAEAFMGRVLAEHLEAMVGDDVPVVRQNALGGVAADADGFRPEGEAWRGKSFLLLGDGDWLGAMGIETDGLAPETMILKTVGNAVIVSGDEQGTRHAVYALLEEMGCRYLWPGELGKVVPRRPDLAVGPLDKREAPRMMQRGMRRLSPVLLARTYGRGLEGLGLEPDEYAEGFSAASSTEQADHGWSAWHRMGRHGRVQQGHSFGDMWRRFGEGHPDWFALQPNRVRDQSRAASRPRLCKTNEGVIAQAVADRAEELRANPEQEGVSVGLNDGSVTSFCMCRECRKLDPPHGPRVVMTDFTAVPRRQFGYVSISDRIMTFTNRVAEGLAEEFPDKHLGFYAYSVYRDPTLRVVPHPNVIIVYVGDSLDHWNGWARFGNRMFWRPNILIRHRRRLMPQNFGREVVGLLRHMYRSGLIGTDIARCQEHWAVMGPTYYVAAAAHWDPARADYERMLEGYCQAGFGPAAGPVREYWGILEELSERSRQEGVGIVEAYKAADLARLREKLDEAAELARAAEDEKVPLRVEFLRKGLEFAELSFRFHNDPNDETREALMDFLGRVAREDPLAVNAVMVRAYAR